MTVEGNKGVVVNENETLLSQSREWKFFECSIRELGGWKEEKFKGVMCCVIRENCLIRFRCDQCIPSINQAPLVWIFDSVPYISTDNRVLKNDRYSINYIYSSTYIHHGSYQLNKSCQQFIQISMLYTGHAQEEDSGNCGKRQMSNIIQNTYINCWFSHIFKWKLLAP